MTCATRAASCTNVDARWSSKSPRPSARKYSSAAEGESSTPASIATLLHGSHAMPPEIAVVPPSCGARSSTVTRTPLRAAASAAASAAAPVPTTTTCLLMPARSFAQWLLHHCEQVLVLHLRPTAVHRDLVLSEEQHMPRHLVARQPFAEKRLDVVLGRSGVLLQLDAQHRDLITPLVGDAERTCELDGLVRLQLDLDLGG